MPTYKILGQADPLAATETAVYTVPSGVSTVVSTINVCNRSSTTSAHIRLSVSPAGAATTTAHYLAYDIEVFKNEIFAFTEGITLQQTDVIRVYTDNATISVNIFGEEN